MPAGNIWPLANSMFHSSASGTSAPSCTPGQSLTNAIAVALSDYIHTDINPDNINIRLTICVLIFLEKLSAAIQSNSLCSQSCWHGTKCPQYEDEVVSFLCFRGRHMPLISLLQTAAAAAHKNSTQSAVASVGEKAIPGWFLPPRYFSIDPCLLVHVKKTMFRAWEAVWSLWWWGSSSSVIYARYLCACWWRRDLSTYVRVCVCVSGGAVVFYDSRGGSDGVCCAYFESLSPVHHSALCPDQHVFSLLDIPSTPACLLSSLPPVFSLSLCLFLRLSVSPSVHLPPCHDLCAVCLSVLKRCSIMTPAGTVRSFTLTRCTTFKAKEFGFTCHDERWLVTQLVNEIND